VGLTATLGTITFPISAGQAVGLFWPAAAFQVVFPIWFGIFGAIPGVAGAMLANGFIGDNPFLFVVPNAIQSCLAGWWFRYRRLDPRLRSSRDWFGLAFVGCVVGNFLGAATGVTESYLRHVAAGDVQAASDYALNFLQWLFGNMLPCWLLTPLMLKAASPMMVRGPFFCQRFFGAVDRGPQEHMRLSSLNDLPINGRLMMLVLLAGLLPLYAVGALTVWGTLSQAEFLAGSANQRAAYDDRNEIERHAELLRAWAREYDRPDYDEQKREQKLGEWRSRPNAFDQLDVTHAALIVPQIPTQLLRVFREEGVAFFMVRAPDRLSGQRLRGAARLPSSPDQVLTGLVVWRVEQSGLGELRAVRGYVVLDAEGHVLYSRGPDALSGWNPPEAIFEGQPKIIKHGGQRWHIAEAVTDYLDLRVITITPALAGRSRALASMPNTLAVLINLAIFGCLIIGAAMARQLADRVLELADRVRAAGGTPGALEVPVRGRDELGYLAGTLNRMSHDLDVYVRELQKTTAEKERLAQQMELARQVQQSVLPKRPPDVVGYELAGLCLPAYEVGGDFYDMFLTRDGRVTLMIGDAVGKGLPAAMFMSETRGIARAASLDGLVPDRVLAVTNRAILSEQQQSGDFVTMFCAQLEPDAHRLSYASAGHNPPVLVQDGRTSPLNLGGFPLAVREEGDYRLFRLELDLGDCVVMYTDGVTEATDPDSRMFQVERLAGVVRRHAAAPAQALVDAIVAEVRRFTTGAPQSDDLTLLVVRRKPADT